MQRREERWDFGGRKMERKGQQRTSCPKGQKITFRWGKIKAEQDRERVTTSVREMQTMETCLLTAVFLCYQIPALLSSLPVLHPPRDLKSQSDLLSVSLICVCASQGSYLGETDDCSSPPVARIAPSSTVSTSKSG